MQLPDTMRAVVARDKQPTLVNRPVPSPDKHEVLIKVHAAGVNRADLSQCLGLYPPPAGASDVLGLELAGEIVAVGDAVEHRRVGDEVMALVAGGGYAEYAKVDARHTLQVPQGFSWIEAATAVETYFTVWDNVFRRAQLQAGEWFMIHGGTSGIGTTAIQLAVAIGAKVIATAGSDEKCQRCLQLGASAAVNYRTQDFVEVAKTHTDDAGVDVILDMVGGDYLARNLDAIALEGRITQIAFMGGRNSQIDLKRLMRTRARLMGGSLRSQSAAQKAAIAADLEQHVAPLWAKGQCKPVPDSDYALDDARSAHARMRAAHIGKVALRVID